MRKTLQAGPVRWFSLLLCAVLLLQGGVASEEARECAGETNPSALLGAHLENNAAKEAVSEGEPLNGLEDLNSSCEDELSRDADRRSLLLDRYTHESHPPRWRHPGHPSRAPPAPDSLHA